MNARTFTKIISLAAIVALLLGLLPQAVSAQSQSHVSFTLGSVHTKPGTFSVPVTLTTDTPILSFRLRIIVPKDLKIVEFKPDAQLVSNNIYQDKIFTNPDGSQLWSIGSASTNGFLENGSTHLLDLTFEKAQITEDVTYTLALTDGTRVNEAPANITLSVNSATATIHLIHLLGDVLAWDGTPIDSDVSISGSTGTLTTTTDTNGSYAFHLGEIDTWGIAVSKNTSQWNTDNILTEQDVVDMINTGLGDKNCPVAVGDLTGDGQVTEQDASLAMRYPLGEQTYEPTVSLVPQESTVKLSSDSRENVVGYYTGDCSGNAPWSAEAVAKVQAAAIEPQPMIEADGITLTLKFVSANSTRFHMTGLPDGSIASVKLVGNSPDQAHAAVANGTSSLQGHGFAGSKNLTVIAGNTTPGFTVQVALSQMPTETTTIGVFGRINEGPEKDLGSVTIEIQHLYLPLIAQ